MGSLYPWSMAAISFQTLFCVTFSWLVLRCKLPPDPTEYHEATLIKLLYLFDPKACEKQHFYNFTLLFNNAETKRKLAILLWPTENPVSADFRIKIQIWLGLHISWFLLGLLNMNQTSRSLNFHAKMMPFTLVGLSLLGLDLVYTCTFIRDALKTGSDILILTYINGPHQNIKRISRIHPTTLEDSFKDITVEDTSWIGLMFAFGSCRCIVLWFINFWIVKDNYFEGLANQRRLMNFKTGKSRRHSKHDP